MQPNTASPSSSAINLPKKAGRLLPERLLRRGANYTNSSPLITCYRVSDRIPSTIIHFVIATLLIDTLKSAQ